MRQPEVAYLRQTISVIRDLTQLRFVTNTAFSGYPNIFRRGANDFRFFMAQLHCLVLLRSTSSALFLAVARCLGPRGRAWRLFFGFFGSQVKYIARIMRKNRFLFFFPTSSNESMCVLRECKRVF